MAEGNEQAFTRLFMHHRGKIYATTLRLTNSRQMAEEILQDVFLKIWLRRKELEVVVNFEAYLHTIARRAAYRGLKQLAAQRHSPGTDAGEQAFHITGEHIFTFKQYNNVLRQAIQKLPPRQQETYLLIRESGLKREEVAAKLDVSPETVKYNLDEATKKVRAYFMAHTDLLPVLVILAGSLKKFS
ncbi:RNA polymerase sigma factor [Filimonas effusa]|uniref:RNA polymerase sigma factor n=1 Tax=Filimonas effusa TaxID=2508721 RepID=A0A4Q1D9W9_9BACT|nr:sigma-70 family RNA polymerase sigma factor [Filimonas effusa]RXK86161.1 sigma-70 family RNA polymerase sigma factor [Filimonas effusa]